MKRVVYQEPFKATVEQRPGPKVEAPTDAVVGITAINIRGPAHAR